MRISDWSSDVCSSDLRTVEGTGRQPARRLRLFLRRSGRRHGRGPDRQGGAGRHGYRQGDRRVEERAAGNHSPSRRSPTSRSAAAPPMEKALRTAGGTADEAGGDRRRGGEGRRVAVGGESGGGGKHK